MGAGFHLVSEEVLVSWSQSKADYINVIGAGLAGSEAAYQIAKRGIPVKLYEMRGVKANTTA